MENERDQASDGSFLLPYSILPFNSISFNIIISSKLMTQTLTACLHFSKIKKDRSLIFSLGLSLIHFISFSLILFIPFYLSLTSSISYGLRPNEKEGREGSQ